MNGPYYCPECHHELEVITGCGSVGYLCDTCKKLVSSKKILARDQLEAAQNPSHPLPDDRTGQD